MGKKRKRALDLLVEVLEQMHCSYSLWDDDDFSVQIRFQGESFLVDITSGYSDFFTIFWQHSLDYDMSDLDVISRVRRSINEINMYGDVIMHYTLEDDNTRLSVYFQRKIYFTEEMSNLNIYLYGILAEFVSAQNFFYFLMNEHHKENTGSDDIDYSLKQGNNQSHMNHIHSMINKAKQAESEQNDEYELEEYVEIHTHKLLEDILQQLGCGQSIEKTGDIFYTFYFQGDMFEVETFDDKVDIDIRYLPIVSIDRTDLNALSCMRKAMNSTNIGYDVTMVYTFDEERNTYSLYFHRSIPLIPFFPNLVYYMRIQLQKFFKAYKYYLVEYERAMAEISRDEWDAT